MSITSLLIIGVICLILGINPLELLSERRRQSRSMPQSAATGPSVELRSRSGDPRPARRHARAHRRTTR